MPPFVTTPRPTNDHVKAAAASQPVYESFIENPTEVTYTGAFAAMTALKPTYTAPANDLTNGRVLVERIDGNELSSWFFGTGADNSTAQAMLVKWERVRAKRPDTRHIDNGVEPLMWVPRPLVVLDITLGATTGADSPSGPTGLVASTHRLADTIALTATGNRTLGGNGVRFGGPANPDDSLATVNVDAEGGCIYEWHLRCVTATGINVVTRPQSRSY